MASSPQWGFHHSPEEQDAASHLTLLSNGGRAHIPAGSYFSADRSQQSTSSSQSSTCVDNNTTLNDTRHVVWKKRDRHAGAALSNYTRNDNSHDEKDNTDVAENTAKKLKTSQDHVKAQEANVPHSEMQVSVHSAVDATEIDGDTKKLRLTVDDDCKSPSLAPAPFFFYRDHSQVPDDDPLTPLTAPGRVPNFPAKMHAILSRPDLADVVAWLPHGRSWRVLKPREFEIRVIPTYFEHAKFSSFIRQANGWGFRRITQGRDRNSYYNELFLKGLPHLCKNMRRPGVNQKPAADPEHEPDFAKISEIYPLPETNLDDESIMLECTVKGGPKARMPVSFRCATASLQPFSQSAVLSHDTIKASSQGNGPHDAKDSTSSETHATSTDRGHIFNNLSQLQITKQQDPLVPQNQPNMFSSLQFSLQAAQDLLLNQQVLSSGQHSSHPHYGSSPNVNALPIPHSFHRNRNHSNHQNEQQANPHTLSNIHAQVQNPFLNEFVRAQAQNINVNLNNITNSSATVAASHLHSAANHFRSALNHALALSNTPEFLAAVATTTRSASNPSSSVNSAKPLQSDSKMS